VVVIPGRAPAGAIDGICTTSGGATVATGDGAVAVRSAPGAAWTVSPTAGVAPDDDEDRLERLACVSGTTIVGAGPSYARASNDLGATWGPADIAIFGATPSVTDIERGPSGAWIAVGALYIGRSMDGKSFAPSTDPSSATWLYGVAAAPGGKWWAVGEAGTLLASTDDGVTWTIASLPTAEDLYAVSFWDASRGIAVGLHGAAVLTTDGGATWRDVSTGLDAMNSDVTWLDRATVLVVGGAGTALRRTIE
jgi:hypothetical protein